MSDPLPEELKVALAGSEDRRGPFGVPLVFLRETPSTNDVAAALAERGASEGTTVVASAQTAGRGRLGRIWFSPAGAGVYASVVCRNQRAIRFASLAGGVAVADGIRRATGLPVTIKWPNDVVIADGVAPARRRKLAGVLAEGSTAGEGVRFLALGFGVNVRQASYPPDLSHRATALETELGRAVDWASVLVETLAALNEQMTTLARGDTGALLRRWRTLSPSATGSSVQWSVQGTTHRGTTAGIDEAGALLVRVGSRTERVIAGELVWG